VTHDGGQRHEVILSLPIHHGIEPAMDADEARDLANREQRPSTAEQLME
jgi:hypothetical protein